MSAAVAAKPAAPAETPPSGTTPESAERTPTASGQPETAQPDKAALEPPTPDPAPKLTTEILAQRIRDSLTGQQKDEPEKAKAPSPAAEPEITDEEEVIEEKGEDEEQDVPPARLAPEAVAALAKAREKKRELKEQLKAKDEELAGVREEMRQLTERLETLEAKPKTSPLKPQTSHLDLSGLPPPPELAQAEQAVAQQRHLVTWANARLKELHAATEQDDGGAGIVQRINSELKDAKIHAPATPAELALWLESARDSAQEELAEARIEASVLRQRITENARKVREEAREFALAKVPALKDPKSSESQKAATIRKLMPGLDRSPLAERFIAAAVHAWMQWEAEGMKADAETRGRGDAEKAAPPKREAKLPGAPAAKPATPQSGGDSSAQWFEKMRTAKTETEREQYKAKWMAATLASV
jgi:hypothetical protein